MKPQRIALSALTVLGTLAVWSIASRLLSSRLLLPSPAEVLDAFLATYPDILLHALATLARALTGLVCGTVLGLLAGISMNWNQVFYRFVNPVVESLRPVPTIAAIPFFILWFGTGDAGQVLLIALSCGTVFAIDVLHAIRGIPPLMIRAAQSLGAGRATLYRTIVIPAIVPSVGAGLRIIAALAFTITIASEFMGAQWGLGFIIMRARRSLETQTIFLGVLLVGLLARATDLALQKVLAHLTRWSESSTQDLQRRNE